MKEKENKEENDLIDREEDESDIKKGNFILEQRNAFN